MKASFFKHYPLHFTYNLLRSIGLSIIRIGKPWNRFENRKKGLTDLILLFHKMIKKFCH